MLEEDVAYHTGNDVTCDVAVRRAINLAIDREQLIDNVLNGYGRPAFSVGDGMPWSSPICASSVISMRPGSCLTRPAGSPVRRYPRARRRARRVRPVVFLG